MTDQANASYLPFAGGVDPIEGSIKVNGALGSAAYHFALDKKRKTVIALGIQGGTLSRSIDGRFKFEDEILNGGASMDMLPETDKRKSLLDISGGITLTGSTSDKSSYRIGISAMHINQPKNSVLESGGSRSELPMRLVGYATYHMDLNEKFLIIPSILYQSISSANELSLQGLAGYKMPEQNLVVKGGLGYRLGDAVEVLVGVDFKALKVGASYDITTSDLASPNGAFEIAVSYIAKIYKRPKVDPVMFCPRF